MTCKKNIIFSLVASLYLLNAHAKEAAIKFEPHIIESMYDFNTKFVTPNFYSYRSYADLQDKRAKGDAKLIQPPINSLPPKLPPGQLPPLPPGFEPHDPVDYRLLHKIELLGEYINPFLVDHRFYNAIDPGYSLAQEPSTPINKDKDLNHPLFLYGFKIKNYESKRVYCSNVSVTAYIQGSDGTTSKTPVTFSIHDIFLEPEGSEGDTFQYIISGKAASSHYNETFLPKKMIKFINKKMFRINDEKQIPLFQVKEKDPIDYFFEDFDSSTRALHTSCQVIENNLEFICKNRDKFFYKNSNFHPKFDDEFTKKENINLNHKNKEFYSSPSYEQRLKTGTYQVEDAFFANCHTDKTVRSYTDMFQATPYHSIPANLSFAPFFQFMSWRVLKNDLESILRTIRKKIFLLKVFQEKLEKTFNFAKKDFSLAREILNNHIKAGQSFLNTFPYYQFKFVPPFYNDMYYNRYFDDEDLSFDLELATWPQTQKNFKYYKIAILTKNFKMNSNLFIPQHKVMPRLSHRDGSFPFAPPEVFGNLSETRPQTLQPGQMPPMPSPEELRRLHQEPPETYPISSVLASLATKGTEYIKVVPVSIKNHSLKEAYQFINNNNISLVLVDPAIYENDTIEPHFEDFKNQFSKYPHIMTILPAFKNINSCFDNDNTFTISSQKNSSSEQKYCYDFAFNTNEQTFFDIFNVGKKKLFFNDLSNAFSAAKMSNFIMKRSLTRLGNPTSFLWPSKNYKDQALKVFKKLKKSFIEQGFIKYESENL